MTDRHAKVIILPAWDGGSGKSARMESLRDAVEELDELECCLRQLAPQLRWSAQQWMIASTHFRMLLIGARKRLNDLRSISSAGQRNAISWELELNDACLEAEGRLRDIDVCLDMLQRADASPAERARETEIFASSKSMLLKTLRKIWHLANQSFPMQLGED